MIRKWCEVGADEIAAADSPAVAPTVRILAQNQHRLAALNAVADRLYTRWLAVLA
jgi:hypothetical protein